MTEFRLSILGDEEKKEILRKILLHDDTHVKR